MFIVPILKNVSVILYNSRYVWCVIIYEVYPDRPRQFTVTTAVMAGTSILIIEKETET